MIWKTRLKIAMQIIKRILKLSMWTARAKTSFHKSGAGPFPNWSPSPNRKPNRTRKSKPNRSKLISTTETKTITKNGSRNGFPGGLRSVMKMEKRNTTIRQSGSCRIRQLPMLC